MFVPYIYVLKKGYNNFDNPRQDLGNWVMSWEEKEPASSFHEKQMSEKLYGFMYKYAVMMLKYV